MRLTSFVNSRLLSDNATRSVLDFSSSRRFISAARALTAVVISSALPTKLRATSVLSPTKVRSTSPAFGFSGAGLDGIGQMIDPLREQVGGCLAAGLDLLRHGFGASQQQFLEPADAGIEVVGNFHGTVGKGLVDVFDLGAKGVDELGS